MALDLLSIGDASLDVFLTPVESETFCRLDTKECFISFSYGDKIPVKRMELLLVEMLPIMQWEQRDWA